ncbi:ASCH domain-containing protein [Tessaracoccus terricola]
MEQLEAFWQRAQQKARLTGMPSVLGGNPLATLRPPAWSFGATPEHADELLELVLDGTKTATASAFWDYEAEGEELPSVGTLSIVTDGAGVPRALLGVTRVRTVPFDEVDDAHAHAEGEQDRTLASWREIHERFFTEHASHQRGFAPDMPVVLEEFEVLYSEP